MVLAYFENDPEDNIRANLFGLKNGELVTNSTTYIPGVKILNRIDSFAILRWLSQNSYLYSVGVNGVWEYEKRQLGAHNASQLTSEMAVRTTNSTAYVEQYQKDLTGALVKRMYAFCKAHDVKLITVEIPGMGDPNPTDFKPSITPDLRDTFRENCDAFIETEATLADYRGLIYAHVPHGHHHMTEEGHLLYGIQIAKAMERLSEKKPGS